MTLNEKNNQNYTFRKMNDLIEGLSIFYDEKEILCENIVALWSK